MLEASHHHFRVRDSITCKARTFFDPLIKYCIFVPVGLWLALLFTVFLTVHTCTLSVLTRLLHMCLVTGTCGPWYIILLSPSCHPHYAFAAGAILLAVIVCVTVTPGGHCLPHVGTHFVCSVMRRLRARGACYISLCTLTRYYTTFCLMGIPLWAAPSGPLLHPVLSFARALFSLLPHSFPI